MIGPNRGYALYKPQSWARKSSPVMRFQPRKGKGRSDDSAPLRLPPGVRWVQSLDLPVGRVYAYERLSTEQQVKGSGTKRQTQYAEAWCEEHGLKLDEELQLRDIGKSAFHKKHLLTGDLGRFIRLAEQRKLGPNPFLLVENLDRLSRSEPVEAYEEIISKLIRQCDVTLVVLQKHSYEIYEKNSIDMLKLMRLVVELEKSAKYAQDLSERMERAWDDTRDKMRTGVIERPRQICPGWCDVTDEGKFVINEERAETVKRLVELYATHGQRVTAGILNDENRSAFGRWRRNDDSRKIWSAGSVRDVVRNDALWGAFQMNTKGLVGPCKTLREDHMYWDEEEDKYDRHHYSHRSKAHAENGEYEIIEGVFPALYSKDEVERVRALAETRQSRPADRHVAKSETMRWFGSGLTYCECGHLIQWCHGRTAWKNQDGLVHPELNPHEIVTDKRYGKEYTKRYYLSCASKKNFKAGDPRRCEHKFMPMIAVSAHVLNRLRPEALQAFVDHKVEADGKNLAPMIDAAKERIAEKEQKLIKVKQALESSIEEAEIELGRMYIEKKQELEADLEEERGIIRDLQVEQSIRVDPPHLGEASEAIQDLRDHLVDWTSTKEQRQRVNRVLKDLGVTIHLNGTEQTVGISYQGGEIDWQPLNGAANIAANRDGAIQGWSEPGKASARLVLEEV